MNSWLRVVIAGVLGIALGASTAFDPLLVLIACVIVVVCFAFGWPRLVDSPQPWATTVSLTVFGLLGVGSVWLADEESLLFWLPVLAGLGILATFVQQIVRGPGATNVVLHVAAQVTGVATVLAVASWLAAVRAPGDGDVVIVSVVALVVALAVTVIPWPARYTSPLAIVLGAGAAVAAALVLHEMGRGTLGLLPAAAMGAVLSLLVAAVHRLLGMAIYLNFPSGHSARRALHPPKGGAAAADLGAPEVGAPAVGVLAAETSAVDETAAESATTFDAPVPYDARLAADESPAAPSAEAGLPAMPPAPPVVGNGAGNAADHVPDGEPGPTTVGPAAVPAPESDAVPAPVPPAVSPVVGPAGLVDAAPRQVEIPVRGVSWAQAAGLQIALGVTPLALGGVVVYAAERLFVG